MIKHRWRELAKTFGNHVDQDKREQMRRAKAGVSSLLSKSDMENNVTRIFKLVKHENLGKKDGSRKESKNEKELVALIENFYQQYQSLYALYDHLIGESARIARSRKVRTGSPLSPSSSSSDSEYFSSDEIDNNNVKLENREHQEIADRAKQEPKTENVGVIGLKHIPLSRTSSEEKDAINSEYLAALRKVQQAEIANDYVRNEVDERVKELSALVEAHEQHGTSSLHRVKELESQLAGFKTDLGSLCSQKRDLEAWKEGTVAEVKQLGDKTIGLHARILELELILKDKNDEISDLQKKIDNENSATSKVAYLMAQTSNLQHEVESLRTQKGEMEERMACVKIESSAQVKGLTDKVNIMKQELETLRWQRAESAVQMDKKNKEISQERRQIEALKEQLTRKDLSEKQILEEKQRYLKQVKDMEFEMDSLRSQRKNLEKQKRSKIHEADKLRRESEGLRAKIAEMERTLSQREGEVSALCKECEVGKNETSTRQMALRQENEDPHARISELEITLKERGDEVCDLKHDLDTLHTEKRQLELQAETKNKEYSERQTTMEGEMADQQRVIEEHENTIKQITKQCNNAKLWFPESKLNLQLAERKMEEMAVKYRVHFQDNVRLLNQRIRVAEQIHNDTKESYRKMKDEYHKETTFLREKLAFYENPIKKMKEMSETAKRTLNRFDRVTCRFEKEHDNFSESISKMSDEVQVAKSWVTEATSEIKRLKHQADCLVAQLDDKEQQESLLREKVWKLEATASKEAGEKLNLMTNFSQLEKQVTRLERTIKERDEDLLSLGEEKREVIRQLCILIDHHRSRYDDLKQVISKRSAKSSTVN